MRVYAAELICSTGVSGFQTIHTAYIKATHIRSEHVNKLSLLAQLPFGEGRFLSVPRNSFPYFMANVEYPAGQGALAQAAFPAAQGIQPADELAAHGAQAAGGQVAQVVQQVVGQEALPAAEHVAQEILPAAAQVPQQAVGQAQHGELKVEYVYFRRLGFFFFFVLSFSIYI